MLTMFRDSALSCEGRLRMKRRADCIFRGMTSGCIRDRVVSDVELGLGGDVIGGDVDEEGDASLLACQQVNVV